jgi:TetR/AcrR family transcriptional regulator, transcriptional repressor for nem operon
MGMAAPPTVKEEQKARSHAAILDSASQLLRERGISGARVGDVMKGAGLTVGGFYAHFASKEALIEVALRRTGSRLRERLFANLEGKSPSERIELVLKRYLSPHQRDDFQRGCPLPAVVGEVGSTAPEYGSVLAEQIETFASELAKELPETRAVPKRALALALVALMYGGLSLARALRGSALSEEVLSACRTVGAFAAESSTRA